MTTIIIHYIDGKTRVRRVSSDKVDAACERARRNKLVSGYQVTSNGSDATSWSRFGVDDFIRIVRAAWGEYE